MEKKFLKANNKFNPTKRVLLRKLIPAKSLDKLNLQKLIPAKSSVKPNSRKSIPATFPQKKFARIDSRENFFPWGTYTKWWGSTVKTNRRKRKEDKDETHCIGMMWMYCENAPVWRSHRSYLVAGSENPNTVVDYLRD